MKRLVFVLVFGMVVGCDASLDGGNPAPMGSGHECEANLAAVVDENYLLEAGIEIREPTTASIAIGGVIAEVCFDGSE